MPPHLQANKAVFQIYGFVFPIALTLFHTVSRGTGPGAGGLDGGRWNAQLYRLDSSHWSMAAVVADMRLAATTQTPHLHMLWAHMMQIVTWVWMNGAALLGFFEIKDIPQAKLLPLSISHVSYITLSNLRYVWLSGRARATTDSPCVQSCHKLAQLCTACPPVYAHTPDTMTMLHVMCAARSLQLNTMGFAQIAKIAIVPTVILLELVMFGRVPTVKVRLVAVCFRLGRENVYRRPRVGQRTAWEGQVGLQKISIHIIMG